MRVTCTKVVDAIGRPMDESPWLSLGEEYVVLAVAAEPERHIALLFSHGGTDIGWWDSRAFVTVDERIPST